MHNSFQLVHFGISVSDLERSIQWYCKHFGFKEVKRFEKPELQIKGAALVLGDSALEILEPTQPATPDKTEGSLVQHLQKTGANHLALNVDNIMECYERLKQENVTIVSDLIGGRFFFCKDPDQTLLEIRQNG